MFKRKMPVAACVLTAAIALVSQPSVADVERFIVKFKAGKGNSASALVNQQGGRVERMLTKHNAIAVSLPTQAAAALTHNPNIEYIEEDVKRYPLAQSIPYGIGMVQADQVTDGLAGNKTVCIIDSGYQLAHEDLSGNQVTGTNDSGTGNWYEDDNHHGTHVAGTIAALNNNVGVVGVLPNGNINLHIVKVFDANGRAYSSSLVAALDVCTSNGADVVNMSLGGTRASRSERVAFQSAFDSGVLNIAAAGNDGNTRHSYPASYDSVVSVAAIDSNKSIASFSQQTDQVELSGPGVGVVSSVAMGTGTESSVVVNNTVFESITMDGSPFGSITGSLVDCGTGEVACSGAAGNVCLIQRGNVSFADKVLNCQSGGGVGAIIYNNEPGILVGTLGGASTIIPSVGVSDTDGSTLLTQLSNATELSVEQSNYAAFDGTSMATPHVAGVAALVWSHYQDCSNGEIRAALQNSAQDLGLIGRDNAYGFGLVQAADALSYLTLNACTGTNPGGGGNGGGGGGNDGCKGGPKKCP